MKKVIIIIVLLFICFSVLPDIPRDIAIKEYTPTFIEWVLVYFKAMYESENIPNYALYVSYEIINDQIRIIFICNYTNNEMGIQFYNEHLPSIKSEVETQCQTWTYQGYPISMNDIVFNVSRIY